MKKNLFFHLMLATVISLGVCSCTDDTIGMSITDTQSVINEDSSFVITGHSVLNKSVQSRTTNQLIGIIKAVGYGTLSSEVASQFMPATIDTVNTTVDMLDSCRLKLRIAYTGGYTGDSLAPMRINVYRLNKQLPNPIYSDFDPTDYYDEDDLLGTTSYSVASAATAQELGSNYVYQYYREIYVPMPLSWAQELFNKYKSSPETFATPSAFAQYFPGIYIKNTYGSGRVMNFTNTELEVFYRYHTTSVTSGADTTYSTGSSYLGATPEIVSNNIISLDIADEIMERVNNGEAILMSPAGLEVQVKFPIQDIIDTYKSNIGENQAALNELRLEIPVEEIYNEFDIAPPTYVLMVKTALKDQFIAGDSLTNNKDSFYATYSSTDKAYIFTGLRDYILNILKNKGGVADEEDINLTITPVDLTTYTTTSSSYYYYSTSSTTITKISPAVSTPSLARLRLDKAKIKVTYSKQTLF